METIDISGMGGGYERCCQLMLLRGMKFLEANPDFNWSESYKGSPSLYGLLISESFEAKILDEVIVKDLGSSGAQHQAVIGHLHYIAEHGYQGWIDYFRNELNQADRIYELDESQLEENVKQDIKLWEAKLDAGYDPLANLREIIPEDQWINVNPDDPESMKKGIKKLIEKIEFASNLTEKKT